MIKKRVDRVADLSPHHGFFFLFLIFFFCVSENGEREKKKRIDRVADLSLWIFLSVFTFFFVCLKMDFQF